MSERSKVIKAKKSTGVGIVRDRSGKLVTAHLRSSYKNMKKGGMVSVIRTSQGKRNKGMMR